MALTLATLLAYSGLISNLLSTLASLAALQVWWANRQKERLA
jgi:hypothetical protein